MVVLVHVGVALVMLALVAGCGGGTSPSGAAKPAAGAPAPAAVASPAVVPATSAAGAAGSSTAAPSAAGSVSAATSAGSTPRPAAPLAPPVAVKVGVLNSLSDAGIYIASDRAYFKDEGLDVTLERFGNTAEMTAPLAAEQLDVGAGAPTPSLFNAVSRDIPVKLVADKGVNSRGHGFNALVVRRDLVDSRQVQTLDDLRGLKLASPSQNSPMEIQVDSGLKSVGLDLGVLDVVTMPFPDMVPALANRSVDAAAMIEPFVTIAVTRDVGVRFKGADELYPDQQIAGILYGPAFTQQRPEAARRWMVAYLRGVRDFVAAFDAGQDKATIVGILTAHTTVTDPALYDRMVLPGFQPDGYLSLSSIVADQDWYAQRGLVRERQPVGDLVDYQYLDYAHERLGRVGPRQTAP